MSKLILARNGAWEHVYMKRNWFWVWNKTVSSRACSGKLGKYVKQCMLHYPNNDTCLCWAGFYLFLSFFTFPLHESTTKLQKACQDHLWANHRIPWMLLVKDNIFSTFKWLFLNKKKTVRERMSEGPYICIQIVLMDGVIFNYKRLIKLVIVVLKM